MSTGNKLAQPPPPTSPQFKGDQKSLEHWWMKPLEKRVIAVLLPIVPSWLGTEQLTLMTLFWSAGVIFFGYLSADNLQWLWAFNACIALQHITDMLDGAVGRARNTGLIRWGFYADHFLDYIFTCAIVIGYSFLLPSDYHFLTLACVALAGGLMAHTFLDFAITNDFKISYCRIGSSECRWLLIIFNVICIFKGKDVLIKTFPFVVLGLLCILLGIVYSSQALYRKLDIEHSAKNSGDQS
jgi:phosphatidylglycerophosphate synthase